MAGAPHRVASLDLLRGIAAFAVAIPHFLMTAGAYADAAEMVSILSVEVFFTLSGFVLAPQTLSCMRGQRPADLGVFLVRRWMRTVPPFALALAGMAVLSGQVFTPDIWRTLFYVQNLFGQANQVDVFPVAWSLSIEEWFYVLFPPLIFGLYRLAGGGGWRFEVAVTVGFIAVVTILRLAVGDHRDWGADVRRVVAFRVDAIAYGTLLYLWIGRLRGGEVDIARRIRPAVAATCLAASVLAAVWCASRIGFGDSRLAEDLFPFAAAALGTSAIAAACAAGAFVERHALLRRLGEGLGRISYSVYLFHLIAIRIVETRCGGLPVAAQLVILLVILVAFGAAFFAYFERPILDARPRYHGRRECRPEAGTRTSAGTLDSAVRSDAPSA